MQRKSERTRKTSEDIGSVSRTRAESTWAGSAASQPRYATALLADIKSVRVPGMHIEAPGCPVQTRLGQALTVMRGPAPRLSTLQCPAGFSPHSHLRPCIRYPTQLRCAIDSYGGHSTIHAGCHGSPAGTSRKGVRRHPGAHAGRIDLAG